MNRKPDIVVTHGSRTWVLATKWKLPEGHRPSDSDLNQIYVYSHRYAAQAGWLLYPLADVKGTNVVKQVGQYWDERHCGLLYLPVATVEEGQVRLNRELGTAILTALGVETQ